MFNKKEISIIIAVSIILAFLITLIQTTQIFFQILLAVFLSISINSFAKKISAFYLESEVEIKLWEFKKYGLSPRYKFKKDFPAGFFIPIISKIFLWPLKGFIWMASLVFDVKAKTYRVAKRHGIYSFSEMSESDIAIIAAAGIFANLVFALIGYLLNYPMFSKINIWLAFFNMIPLSDLDGNKIFFGNKIIWNILAILTLLAMLYSFLLV